MWKRVRETTVGSLLTSKRVAVATVAAVAMLLGTMSVGANWLAHKKLAGLADAYGKPYVLPSAVHRSSRHSADTSAPAVASAATEVKRSSPRKKAPKVTASAAPVPNATPVLPAVLTLGAAAGLPEAALKPVQNIGSQFVPSLVPSVSSAPVPPGANNQPPQLLSPITNMLPSEIQVTAPGLNIKVGL